MIKIYLIVYCLIFMSNFMFNYYETKIIENIILMIFLSEKSSFGFVKDLLLDF